MLHFFTTYPIRDSIREVAMTESEMHTHLMPDEEDIASVPEDISWSDAVCIIEDIVTGFLNDPEPVDEELQQEVWAAWKRIMRG